MRRLIIAVGIVALAGGSAVAGWHYLRPHDALAEARTLLNRGDIRAAQLVLRSAAQADPARAETHVRLGQVQQRLGDPAAAEHEFRTAGERGWDAHALRPLLAQAVVAQGRNAEVLHDYTVEGLTSEQAAIVLVARAQAQLALGQQKDSATSIAEAERLAPASLDTALAAARLAMAAHDMAAAEGHVTAALAIDPHALEALAYQAQLREMRGDRPAALASYTAAIDQAQASGSPEGATSLRLERARLLVAMNDTDRARADLDIVLKAQPKQPMAQYLSALLFARAANWKAADDALAAVGPALPRMPRGDFTLAVVKANLGQPEQAIAAAERQVARTPGDLDAAKLLAKLDLAQKQPGRAAEALTAAAAVHPLDSEGLDLLGTAYAGAGQAGPAITAMEKAATLTPGNAQVLTRLAALEMRRGNASGAEQALERALDVTEAAPPPVRPVSAEAPPPPAMAQGPTQAQTAAALVTAALQAGDIDRAVAALDRLKQAKGEPLQFALLDGTVKLARIDLDGARAAFEQAVEIDPKSMMARVELARAIGLQGHTDDAIGRLQAILTTDPTYAAALVALVNLDVAAGRTDQAVAAVEAARKAAPPNASFIAGLGQLYLRLGQTQKALDTLDAAPKPSSVPSPADNEVLALRAQAQLTLGQRGAAIQTMHALLDRTPDNALMRRQLAELLAVDQKYDEAQALLREGLARRPGDPVLLAASIAVAQRQGGPDAALARVTELARDPANPTALTLKGDLLLSEGRFNDAVAVYQAQQASLPKDDPLATAVQIRTAQAVAAGGDRDKAAAMLRDWLTTHPESPDVALVLASLDIEANRLPEARLRLQSVLTSQPNNALALNNLAWISQQQGDLAAARTLASRAYLLSKTPQAADTLGWIILAQGQPADAVALLREAASALPADPAIQYHLAAALARDGNKDAAVALLKPLIDKPAAGFGEKPQAAKLLAELAP
jgi:tetratricopeptide (TPR) repeat protein